MEQFKDIDLKFQCGALFGILAIVISIIAGFVAGNTVGQVLIRTLIFTGLFIALGIVVVYVLERFVPEVLERFQVEGADAEAEARMTAEMSEAETNTSSLDETVPDVDVVAEDEDAVPLAESFPAAEMDEYSDVRSDGKLGRHFIKDEKTIKYEPRIMAEAIRTMLKRDEE